jgi:hypothetical protein
MQEDRKTEKGDDAGCHARKDVWRKFIEIDEDVHFRFRGGQRSGRAELVPGGLIMALGPKGVAPPTRDGLRAGLGRIGNYHRLP